MKMQSDIKACNKHAGPPCPFSCPLHVSTLVDFMFSSNWQTGKNTRLIHLKKKETNKRLDEKHTKQAKM